MLSVSLMLSCVNEVDDVSDVKHFDSFTVTSEANVRTVLNSNMTIGWVKGDEVAINDGEATWKFVAEPSASSNRNATISPSDDVEVYFTEGSTYYALYPYIGNAVWTGSKVSFRISSTYAPKANTFPYNPSVSSTTTSSIKFYNICSLIGFSLISENITKIVFSGADGENMAGYVSVDCADTTPDAVVTDGVKPVTLEGNFTAGTDYYVTVLPNNFKKGLIVSMYNEEGKVVTRTSAPFNLPRSSRIEMGVIDDEQTWVSAAHPVLFFNHAEGEAVKANLGGSLSTQWRRVTSVADRIAAKNPPSYRSDDTDSQPWQREVGTNISHLAFTGYMSEEQKYMDAAYKWAYASCTYPTWGVDGTEDGMEFGLSYGHQLLGIAMLYDYGQEYLSSEQLDLLRETLISRTRRQYAAYIEESLNILTNHCHVNLCGMLASAIALKDEFPETQDWIDFALSVVEKTSKLLIPDGVSPEGPGYWQYFMEYLMMNYDMAKLFGKDYYANSYPYLEHTAKYSKYFTLPMNYCSQDNSIINWGDCRHVCWYGPTHLFYRLASVNRCSTTQYWGDEAIVYDPISSWLNILWYDPSVSAIKPVDYPASHHFEEMGIWASRTGWDGGETIAIYRCGAPLGKSLTPDTDLAQGNMGHCHPEAGHFCIYDDGEYIIRNTGYVKRQTKYHNVALFGGHGLWGEVKTWFSPYPFTPERYPRITDIQTDEDKDIVMSDMSKSYKDEAGVESYTRKFIWMKKQNAVIIIDDIDCSAAIDIQLNFYPGSQTGTCEGNVYTDVTGIHKVRIENLSPSATSVLAKETQFVENRNDKNGEDMPLVTIRDNLSEAAGYAGRYVTAISWAASFSEPAVVTYDADSGEITVDGGVKDYHIGNHEGFGQEADFIWQLN